MDTHLAQMFDALGLPHVMPEPEVVASTLTRVRTGALARLIVTFINNNERLLTAERDGATVTVREFGSDAVMQFTITEGGKA